MNRTFSVLIFTFAYVILFSESAITQQTESKEFDFRVSEGILKAKKEFISNSKEFRFPVTVDGVSTFSVRRYENLFFEYSSIKVSENLSYKSYDNLIAALKNEHCNTDSLKIKRVVFFQSFFHENDYFEIDPNDKLQEIFSSKELSAEGVEISLIVQYKMEYIGGTQKKAKLAKFRCP